MPTRLPSAPSTGTSTGTSAGPVPEAPGSAAAFPVQGVDHLHLAVGNARQAAWWWARALGFRLVAYRGPETGHPDTASYVLASGAARVVLTGEVRTGTWVGAHLARHGEGVVDIALRVPDAARAYRLATARGAVGVRPPRTDRDEDGCVVRAAIAAYGPVRHTFVERQGYRGAHLPGFAPRAAGASPGARLVTAVDHVVGNVELGAMDTWVEFYRRVLGFHTMKEFVGADIATEYSALMSKVVADGSHRVKLPLNEPAPGARRSQIQEFLDFHAGPGVQHVALATNDIVRAVDSMRAQGVEFLDPPPAYYDATLARRVGPIRVELAELARRGILVDRDDDGYLLQIFTRPLGDRPTLFCELIERHGSSGFGKGNFRALFEAIEREQARRGNL